MPAHADRAHVEGEHPGVVVPLRLRTAAGTPGLISTTTVFGSPVDVTLQELAIDSFFRWRVDGERCGERWPYQSNYQIHDNR